MPDQRASCFSSPPPSCFTHVAEWNLSVVSPQAQCSGYPVTTFHLRVTVLLWLWSSSGTYLIALSIGKLLSWGAGWFQPLQNGTCSNCQMLGDHARTKPLTTLGLKLQSIKCHSNCDMYELFMTFKTIKMFDQNRRPSRANCLSSGVLCYSSSALGQCPVPLSSSCYAACSVK